MTIQELADGGRLALQRKVLDNALALRFNLS
jgi:hypothetical protein